MKFLRPKRLSCAKNNLYLKNGIILNEFVHFSHAFVNYGSKKLISNFRTYKLIFHGQ